MATPATEVTRPLRRVEYDKLVALGMFENERIELLEGELVSMSPIGAPHNFAVQALTELLVLALRGRAWVRPQMSFAAHELSEPEPDIAVIPRGDYASAHPDQAYLIIEVADTSLASDRDTKLATYAQSGVPEYWIVNLRERCIEVHTSPLRSAYSAITRVERGQTLRPQRFPDVEIGVSDVIR